jgi:hypothetical protein
MGISIDIFGLCRWDRHYYDSDVLFKHIVNVLKSSIESLTKWFFLGVLDGPLKPGSMQFHTFL